MIVLDTTILVYAVGSEHALRLSCRALLAEVERGSLEARTTVEAIQEFAHVWARRRPKADAVRIAGKYAVGLGPLIRPDEEDLHDGLTLFASSSDLGAFDAVLAAAVRRRGWSLASADGGFAEVTGLTHLDPASPSFVRDALQAKTPGRSSAPGN